MAFVECCLITGAHGAALLFAANAAAVAHFDGAVEAVLVAVIEERVLFDLARPCEWSLWLGFDAE